MGTQCLFPFCPNSRRPGQLSLPASLKRWWTRRSSGSWTITCTGITLQALQACAPTGRTCSRSPTAWAPSATWPSPCSTPSPAWACAGPTPRSTLLGTTAAGQCCPCSPFWGHRHLQAPGRLALLGSAGCSQAAKCTALVSRSIYVPNKASVIPGWHYVTCLLHF